MGRRCGRYRVARQTAAAASRADGWRLVRLRWVCGSRERQGVSGSREANSVVVHELDYGWRDVMEPTSNTPMEAAAAELATAATALPKTAAGEDILALVKDLVRITHHLGELTATVRDHWADWGTVTPHLRQAEALTADITRCLNHAAGIYAFNTNRSDPTIPRLASTGTARSAA